LGYHQVHFDEEAAPAIAACSLAAALEVQRTGDERNGATWHPDGVRVTTEAFSGGRP
jgi:hypothetical protein